MAFVEWWRWKNIVGIVCEKEQIKKCSKQTKLFGLWTQVCLMFGEPTLGKSTKPQSLRFDVVGNLLNQRLYSCADPYNGLASPRSLSSIRLGLSFFQMTHRGGSYSIWTPPPPPGLRQEKEQGQTRSLLVNSSRLKPWPNTKYLMTKHIHVWRSGQRDKTCNFNQTEIKYLKARSCVPWWYKLNLLNAKRSN